MNFNFTYAYVLNRDGWLIPELKKKISKQALTEPPDVRNPAGLMGFEKSVFFAMLLSVEYDLLDINELKKHIDGKVNWKAINNTVKSFEEKLAEYERVKTKAAALKKKAKEKADKLAKVKKTTAVAKRKTTRRK
jgi:hypothetical protein